MPRMRFVVWMFGATSALALSPHAFAGEASKPKTRAEFVKAIAQVKEGMTTAEVVALLGKPDDVRTHRDPGGISTTRTKEIWRYGTVGHLTCATLGSVYVDKAGKAQYIYGGRGSPPDEKAFSEMELRRLLRIIDKAPGYYSAYRYDPRRIVEAVNALQTLGKEKALAALGEYLRVASRFHDSGRGGVFLILRCLFDVPAAPGYMPHMNCGAPSMSPISWCWRSPPLWPCGRASSKVQGASEEGAQSDGTAASDMVAFDCAQWRKTGQNQGRAPGQESQMSLLPASCGGGAPVIEPASNISLFAALINFRADISQHAFGNRDI